MSEDVEEGAEGEVAAEPKSKRKLIIMIAAGVVVLLVVLGAVYFLFLRGGGEEEVAVVEAAPAYFYDIPPMTVNLSGDGRGGEQFLKLTVSLELKNEADVEVIEPRMALVRDAFQVYLRELRRSDLEGSAGIFRLKEELRRRVNQAIRPAEIESILFKEILVQ